MTPLPPAGAAEPSLSETQSKRYFTPVLLYLFRESFITFGDLGILINHSHFTGDTGYKENTYIEEEMEWNSLPKNVWLFEKKEEAK